MLPQPVGAIPLAKVVLSFECKQLANLDTLSKSDPQIILYKKEVGNDKWIEFARTEMVKDNLNPKFATSVDIDYYFEQVQPLRFLVIDVDDERGALKDQDIIGEVITTLGAIVGSKGSQFLSKIMHSRRKHNGYFIAYASESHDLKQDVIFQLSASHLDKMDFFGKSDPFLEISRSSGDGSWILVHRTEYILKTLNPTWRQFVIPLHKLNGGDMAKLIKISVWDWNKNGTMDYIGEFVTDLQTLRQKKDWPFINEKKKAKAEKYNNSGVLHINDITLHKHHTFLDYIAGGTEINLVVAIDYTASNGDPKYSSSLHYQNPYEPNDYARAILSVGEILMAYDSDGKVPTFGFGAKMPDGKVSHCFHVNRQPDPEVFGIQGVLEAYTSSFTNGTIAALYGPTNFAPIIRVAADKAKVLHKTEGDIQAYLILLIITDGEITDIDDTIAEIVDASYLPMSIVIVGVGPADFDKMNILDGDDVRLKAAGREAQRDMVQFVPFRDYKRASPAALAAAVLTEVPDQFMQYMSKQKIVPHPPPDARQLAILQEQALARNMSYIAPTAQPAPQPQPVYAPQPQPVYAPQVQPQQVSYNQQPYPPNQVPNYPLIQQGQYPQQQYQTSAQPGFPVQGMPPDNLQY